MKPTIITFLIYLASLPSHAASTQIIAANLGSPVFDNTGTELSVGVDTVNGDGDLFEIGYFTGDTATFSGTWTAITGVSSSNPVVISTIGDLDGQDGFTPVPAGQFSTAFEFDDTVPGTTNDLPASNAQLAIRFYDGATRVGSMYNTVTSSSWQFKSLSATPSPPFPNLDLSDSQVTLVWEDSSNPFKTTLVPEPSSVALLGLGGLALVLRRRRQG